MQHKATPTADTAVLNSVVNLPRALPFLARHTTIHAFLDNDEAGRLTLERLRSALPGYGLEGMTLKVTQTELEQGMTQEDIQAIIEKELDQTARRTPPCLRSRGWRT